MFCLCSCLSVDTWAAATFGCWNAAAVNLGVHRHLFVTCYLTTLTYGRQVCSVHPHLSDRQRAGDARTGETAAGTRALPERITRRASRAHSGLRAAAEGQGFPFFHLSVWVCNTHSNFFTLRESSLIKRDLLLWFPLHDTCS